MPSDYIPIALFIAVATGFALFTLVFSSLLHPAKYNRVKLEPYECGIEPATDARDRYSIRYYLVAMLFVIFDVEIIFLFAWASIWDRLGWYGVAAVLIFTFFVAETLAYVWKRGALDWNVHRRSRYLPTDASDEAA